MSRSNYSVQLQILSHVIGSIIIMGESKQISIYSCCLFVYLIASSKASDGMWPPDSEIWEPERKDCHFFEFEHWWISCIFWFTTLPFHFCSAPPPTTQGWLLFVSLLAPANLTQATKPLAIKIIASIFYFVKCYLHSFCISISTPRGIDCSIKGNDFSKI